MNELTKFANALKLRESSGRYKIVNSFGFMGAYQFGKPRLWDLNISIDGYKPKRFSGMHLTINISKQEFLNNEDLQDQIFYKSVEDLKTKITKSKFYRKFIGKEIDGIKVTLSGMVAAAHLGGLGNLSKFLEYGKDFRDGYNTSIKEYLEKFGGYEI